MTVRVGDKTYNSVEEMFADMKAEFKLKHPIENWIDNLFGGSLFGRAPHYALERPDIVIADGLRELKWAWQRIFKKYDDTVIWSIDWYLSSMIPLWINDLKNIQHGIPFLPEFFGDSLEPTESEIEDAKKKWNAVLDKIILGFESDMKIKGYKYSNDEELMDLENNFSIGFDLFKKYYRNLWD